MKAALMKYLPLSALGVLGVLGLTFTHDSASYTSGPACNAPVPEAAASRERSDERVYYIGCGGLY